MRGGRTYRPSRSHIERRHCRGTAPQLRTQLRLDRPLPRRVRRARLRRPAGARRWLARRHQRSLAARADAEAGGAAPGAGSLV